MASINAVVVPAKALKGGRHKIRIAVAHNGETRYIVTDMVIESEREFRNGSIVRRPDAAFLNTKLRGLLQHYQEAIYNLQYADCLTCPQLVEQIKNSNLLGNHTLQSVYGEFRETARVKPATLATYAVAWSTISRHLNPQMSVAHISYATVLGLEKFMRGKNLSKTTIWLYMNIFSSIVRFAKKNGYVSYKVDPFASYKRLSPEIRDAWLTVEQVRTIRDLDLKKKSLILCRDIFMLSYYLGGINMTDLLEVNFDKTRPKIKYERIKTQRLNKVNRYVEFDIPDEAWEIINKYKGDDGRLDFPLRRSKHKHSGFLRYNFKLLADASGIEHIIYYSARKSFSQHAYELGVGQSVIDYILGHKLDRNGSMLFNYVYVTPEMATEAIRKVLDNLK